MAPSLAAGRLTVDARPSGDGRGVALATNRAGTAALLWRTPSVNGVSSLKVAIREPGRRWRRETVVRRVKGAPARAAQYVWVAIDDRRRVRAMWAVQDPGDEGTVVLQTATQRRSGQWSAPTEVGRAAAGRALGTSVNASWAPQADGTVTVAWCKGGDSDNAFDMSNPGTVFVREASASGEWSAARALWTGQFCSATGVLRTGTGTVFVSWFDGWEELDDSSLWFMARPAGGDWSPIARRLPDLGRGGVGDRTWPLTGQAADSVQLVAQSPYRSRQTGVWHGTLTLADGGVQGAAEVPRPGPGDTLDGWIGGGSWTSGAGWAIDRAGDPVVVFRRSGGVLRGGGLGVDGLWSARRQGSGQWRLSAVDRFAAAGDPASISDDDDPRLSVSTDARGRTTAFWVVPNQPGGCSGRVFRSDATRAGWSARVLVGHAGCPSSGVEFLAGPAALQWWFTSKRVEVRALATEAATGARPSVTLRTRTWRQIRATGAIEFTCRSRVTGWCSVSLLDAERDQQVLDALEGFCRPTVATVPVRAGVATVVRFGLSPACYEGGPAPALRRGRLRFGVLAVSDALGRRSAQRRARVEVTG